MLCKKQSAIIIIKINKLTSY